ncbi:MAG: MFS transporter, partial [Acidobacteriota bacterium]
GQRTAELLRELVATLRRSPALLWTVLGGTLLVYEHAARGLLIVWLQTERGFDLRTATLRAGTMSLVAGLLGAVLGGALADHVERRSSGGRLRLLAWSQLVFGPAAWAMLRLDPHANAIAFHVTWFVAVAGTMMAYGPVLAEIQDLAPARIRSTALAFFLMVSNLLGAGLGPLATGAIGDRRSLTDGFLVSVLVGTASLPLLLAAAHARRREGTARLSPAE